MSDAAWIEAARRLLVVEVAPALGLTVARRDLRPCPACGAERRGSHDKRGPAGMTTDAHGWRCHRCNAGGDALDLIRLVLGRGTPAEWNDVRDWLETRGLIWPPSLRKQDVSPRGNRPQTEKPALMRQASQERTRPPAQQVEALWQACLRMDTLDGSASVESTVLAFLVSRGYSPAILAALDIARILPLEHPWPEWWPGGWASVWRLVVPAYEPDGRLASVHARAVTGLAPGMPKTRWPSGCTAAGLLMADPGGLTLLRGGDSSWVQGVIIAEGLTDYLTAAQRAEVERLPFAILGGTSGSFKALATVSWPRGLTFHVATDPDARGDAYAAEIRAALSPRPVYRLPL